ncbi:glycosyltransferase family 4 protein [Bradyrhizobium roseum]|uniref:glycosyltransferase family 4 protein n=1 Tax=Bradyrhizobium roseum TaxID=3056648 RepID=UPI00260A4D7E|nr:glycosyltransferase family 4 protein [Bradyrhizobium roseus]WKA30521.1 glycosyltransferase family 4 protein [Bradyrhizobium roseus]
MKRVVFAVPGSLDTPTGGYAYDKRIMAELRQLGWDVECLDIGDGFPSPDEATRSAARSLLLKIPDGQPIVIDGLALGVLPDVAADVAGRHPLLGLVHHPLALEWGLSAERADALHRSERAALASVRAVVVTSPATAKLVASGYEVPAGRITVARPGSDPAPRARGSRDGTPHLLAVGAVTPRKGFDVLVAALATLAELPWRLTIAGDLTRDPSEAARLLACISEYGLSGRIAVVGEVSSERLTALYDEADVFVLASRFEGYGMAYSEALSRGLPVIGTKAGAIPDTVPPAAGLLVSPGDAAELSAALRQLIADAELRRRFADGAWASAGTLPTWRQSAAIFAAALEKLS